MIQTKCMFILESRIKGIKENKRRSSSQRPHWLHLLQRESLASFFFMGALLKKSFLVKFH